MLVLSQQPAVPCRGLGTAKQAYLFFPPEGRCLCKLCIISNIGVHILFGTLVFLIGVVPLLTAKGSRAHRRFEPWFLRIITVVLVTAVLGLAVFNFRPFLTLIVLLSVYNAYAGYRTLRIRHTGPTLADGLFSGVFLLGGLAFLALLPRIHLVWSPVVMYSTLGVLLTTTVYDVSRFSGNSGSLGGGSTSIPGR